MIGIVVSFLSYDLGMVKKQVLNKKYYYQFRKTYEKDEDNEKLILPTWHKDFMHRYKENINNKDENLLNCVFLRDYDSIIKTKNY